MLRPLRAVVPRELSAVITGPAAPAPDARVELPSLATTNDRAAGSVARLPSMIDTSANRQCPGGRRRACKVDHEVGTGRIALQSAGLGSDHRAEGLSRHGGVTPAEGPPPLRDEPMRRAFFDRTPSHAPHSCSLTARGIEGGVRRTARQVGGRRWAGAALGLLPENHALRTLAVDQGGGAGQGSASRGPARSGPAGRSYRDRVAVAAPLALFRSSTHRKRAEVCHQPGNGFALTSTLSDEPSKRVSA